MTYWNGYLIPEHIKKNILLIIIKRIVIIFKTKKIPKKIINEKLPVHLI